MKKIVHTEPTPCEILTRILLNCEKDPVPQIPNHEFVDVKVPQEVFSLVSALSKDIGESFDTVFTDSLILFASTIVKFGGSKFSRSRLALDALLKK